MCSQPIVSWTYKSIKRFRNLNWASKHDPELFRNFIVVVEGATNTSAPQAALRWLTQHNPTVLWKREGNTMPVAEALFTQQMPHLAKDTLRKHALTHQSQHTSNHVLRALQGHTWQQEFGREIRAANNVNTTQQAYRSWTRGTGQPKRKHMYLVADWWTVSFQKKEQKEDSNRFKSSPAYNTNARRFWYSWSVGSYWSLSLWTRHSLCLEKCIDKGKLWPSNKLYNLGITPCLQSFV